MFYPFSFLPYTSISESYFDPSVWSSMVVTAFVMFSLCVKKSKLEAIGVFWFSFSLNITYLMPVQV